MDMAEIESGVDIGTGVDIGSVLGTGIREMEIGVCRVQQDHHHHYFRNYDDHHLYVKYSDQNYASYNNDAEKNSQMMTQLK